MRVGSNTVEAQKAHRQTEQSVNSSQNWKITKHRQNKVQARFRVSTTIIGN